MKIQNRLLDGLIKKEQLIRGKQFGIRRTWNYNFSQGQEIVFNLSENTGLPYTILVKSENLEILIDEINSFILKMRPNVMKKNLYISIYLSQSFKIEGKT